MKYIEQPSGGIKSVTKSSKNKKKKKKDGGLETIQMTKKELLMDNIENNTSNTYEQTFDDSDD